MARKVIIDCDPGIDEAVALALALFDPRLEVIAITACAGTVDAERATQNVNLLVEQLDPPLMPRIGSAVDPDSGAAVGNGTLLHGDDGLGNAPWEPVSRQHAMQADKLIERELRANRGDVTVVCTGPLTNLARALGRDHTLVEAIDRVIVAGGSVKMIGNETATSEFNMHFDPLAADQIFQSPTTKSLLPLEITEKLQFGWDLVEKLPPKYTKVGAVLHQVLPYLVRASRQHLGCETISLQAVMPFLMLVEPMLFEWETMAGRVETTGNLTRGATVFDRRIQTHWRPNMEVASGIDQRAARDAFFNCLKYAAQES
ncbi:MAG: nucleoside hydrolase [bacterium]|nr:nucleoside hydrolase [bacterium]